MRSVSEPVAESPSILLKAFDLLGSFNHQQRVLTFGELVRESGLPKSTAHRVIAKLLELGAIERHGDGYRVGMRLFAVASASPASALRDVALPHLEALHSHTRQTVHLAVLRGGDAVYLEKLRHLAAIPSPSLVGGSIPAHCTAVGKVLLAARDDDDLEQRLAAGLVRRTPRSVVDAAQLRAELLHVRTEGFAMEHGEAAAGLACLAMPIWFGDRVLAAISVAFPAQAGSARFLRNPLRETAADISRAIRAHDRPDWLPPST
jgi:DNA-binding IclR family transcriptional regulator